MSFEITLTRFAIPDPDPYSIVTMLNWPERAAEF